MSEGELIAALVAAISALYGALHLEMRKRSEDWKEMYEREREERVETATLALDGIRQANQALQQIIRALEHLPKRREDWQR
jgi:citrate synthase